MATEKDAVLARKYFPESIPHHPWERSECPLVKMWETFPYVLFGWQEDAAVFTIKIHLLRVLVSLRRTGTIWSAKTYRVGKTHQKRKAKAIAKTQWGAWVTLVFFYTWITSFCPLQTHSPPVSHPTLCPGKLRLGTPATHSLALWLQPRKDTSRWSEDGQRLTLGIYSQDLLLISSWCEGIVSLNL